MTLTVNSAWKLLIYYSLSRVRKTFHKAKRHPLTNPKKILKKITENKYVNIDKLNIDMALKVAYAGFLCLSKIIYISTKPKKALFSVTRVIKFHISFFKDNQYTMLCP